jgi:hypothetical protein
MKLSGVEDKKQNNLRPTAHAPRDIGSCGEDGQVQTSAKPHKAALMTEALAELLVTKLNLNGHHAEVCELLANESCTIHDSLVDIDDA